MGEGRRRKEDIWIHNNMVPLKGFFYLSMCTHAHIIFLCESWNYNECNIKDSEADMITILYTCTVPRLEEKCLQLLCFLGSDKKNSFLPPYVALQHSGSYAFNI